MKNSSRHINNIDQRIFQNGKNAQGKDSLDECLSATIKYLKMIFSCEVSRIMTNVKKKEV